MTGSDDEKYRLKVIWNGTRYLFKDFALIYSEEEDFATQPTFGLQTPLQKDLPIRKNLRPKKEERQRVSASLCFPKPEMKA